MVNIVPVENLTLVTDLFSVASIFTNGVFGVMILFVIFFGLLMLLSAFSRADAFLASSFVTLVLTIFLRYIGLVDDKTTLFVLAVFFSALAASYFARGGTGGA